MSATQHASGSGSPFLSAVNARNAFHSMLQAGAFPPAGSKQPLAHQIADAAKLLGVLPGVILPTWDRWQQKQRLQAQGGRAARVMALSKQDHADAVAAPLLLVVPQSMRPEPSWPIRPQSQTRPQNPKPTDGHPDAKPAHRASGSAPAPKGKAMRLSPRSTRRQRRDPAGTAG